MTYSPHFPYDECYQLYTFQALINIFYYFGIFNLFLTLIYIRCMNIITLLPAPTNNIECKFQTLINNLSAAPLNVFRSYKYYSSSYHFRFTIAKYVVMFIIYFFTIYTLTEDEDINDYLSFFIFLYFAFSLNQTFSVHLIYQYFKTLLIFFLTLCQESFLF